MERVIHYLLVMVATAFVLGTVIVVHEFGHLVVAKAFGMMAKEFSIGFGPVLLRRNWRGTEVSVRLLPLGGFVRIVGLEPGEWDIPGGFYARPPLQRALVLVAGGIFNLTCAFFLFTLSMWAIGVPSGGTNEVKWVKVGSPAERAGIRRGDRIVGINGKFCSLKEIVETVERSPGRRVVLLVRRGGRVIEVPVVPRAEWSREIKGGRIVARRVGRIGVAFRAKMKRLSLLKAMGRAARGIAAIFGGLKFFFQSIGRLFKPESVIGGPIAIVKEVEAQVEGGLGYLLILAGGLSAFLGILNLLPFPALDGGRLVFTLLAAIGIRVHPRTETRFHMAGFALLMVLVLLVTAQDIWRIAQ